MCACSASIILGQESDALIADRKMLTLKAAKEIAAAAERKAIENKTRNIVAIVDESGTLLYLERMDDATPGSVDVAIAKARTAALFHTSTKTLADGLASGRTILLKVPNLLPAEGAVPIMVEGKVVGAIGVSGATSSQDAAAAQEGADWLTKHLKDAK